MSLSDTLGLVFLFLNVESFILMWVDKRSSRKASYRIPEGSFTTLALVGGGVGIIIGGLLFKHKTSKPSFMFKVGLAMVVNIIVVLFVMGRLMV